MALDGELVVTTTNEDPSTGTSLLTNKGARKTYNGVPVGKSLVDISTTDTMLLNPSFPLMEAQTDKKYKNMMRKRLLRQCDDYRQQETVRSRNRMKLRRSDPDYREKERERDRERRRASRTNNPTRRAIERERDRLYKKRLRDNNKVGFVVDSVSQEIILIDSSNKHSMGIEPPVTTAI